MDYTMTYGMDEDGTDLTLMSDDYRTIDGDARGDPGLHRRIVDGKEGGGFLETLLSGMDVRKHEGDRIPGPSLEGYAAEDDTRLYGESSVPSRDDVVGMDGYSSTTTAASDYYAA